MVLFALRTKIVPMMCPITVLQGLKCNSLVAVKVQEGPDFDGLKSRRPKDRRQAR